MLLIIFAYVPVFSLITIITTLLVRQSKGSKAKLLFSLFSYLLAFWILFLFLTDLSDSQSSKLLFLRLAMAMGTFATTVFPFFAAEYIGRKLNHIVKIYILLSCLVLVVLGFGRLMVSQVSNDFGAQPVVYGWLYEYQSLYTAVTLLASMGWLIYGTSKRPQLRNKVRFIIYGLFISLVLNLLSGFVFVSIDKPQLGSLLAPSSILVFFIFTYVSLTRYRTFDVRPHMARLFIYFLCTAGFVAFFGVMGNVIAHTANRSQEMAIHAIIYALSLPLFSYAIRAFNHFSRKYFFRHTYDIGSEINALLELMVKESSKTKLLKKIPERLGNVLSVENIEFIEEKKNKKVRPNFVESGNLLGSLQKRDSSIEAVVAVSDDSGLCGYLALGPKKNGSSYTADDKELAEACAINLGIVLQNIEYTEKITAFNTELKEKVARATNNLRKTNKELKNLNESKDEMFSMVAHQMRPQLTAARGFISMSNDISKNAEMKRLLNYASTGIERTMRIMSDLLNLSRYSKGLVLLEKHPTDITQVVLNELESLKPILKTASVTIKKAVVQKDIMANIDDVKVREVIANLCHNAIQYSPKDTNIVVSLEKIDTNVVFYVRDFGIGVSKEHRRKLFHRFERSNEAKDIRPAGAGIGLYLAKKVIDAHSGEIFYKKPDDELGGSIFGFSLPPG